MYVHILKALHSTKGAHAHAHAKWQTHSVPRISSLK